MTREEAINILYGIQADNLNLDNAYTKDKYEALAMAIQALEQEPVFFPSCQDCNIKMDEIRRAYDKLQKQEPCEDAISRAEVLNLIDSKDPNYEVRHFKEDVECLPPVTPQQRIGKWIKSRDNYGNNHFTCPFCEHDIATKYAGTWDDNYCSNCGARLEMEG